MMSLLKHLNKPSHDDVVATVEDALRRLDYAVEREPIVGTVRPDIVAARSDGTTFVIEVKDGPWDAHLGAVAQVEAYRNAVAADRGADANGILLIAGTIPDGLEAVAQGAGIELVEAGSGDVASVTASLARSGVAGDRTPTEPPSPGVDTL